MNMNIKSIAAAGVLCLLAAGPACAQTKYISSDNGVRLRKDCTEDADSITVIRFGEEVEVISERITEERTWVKVAYQDQEGYVAKDYLTEENPLENMEYLGTWMITAYAETGNCCANGAYPSLGYTVACNSLPFGTKVFIAGVGTRTVEDRGSSSMGDSWIDLYLGNTSDCIQWGVQYLDVYRIVDSE